MFRAVAIVLVVLVVGVAAIGCLRSQAAPQIGKLEDLLGGRPVRYSRELVAYVRAAGALPDIVGVMDDKARVLVAVARLADTELTTYQPAEGERGPAPQKRFVRDLALGFLVHSNLYLNSETTRQLLGERVRDSDDLRTQLLLAPIVDSLLGSATRSAMPMPDAPLDLQPAVTSWIDWTAKQLASGPDPMRVELVLVRIAALGRYGTQLGLADRIRPMLDTIISARGDVALTAGAPAARFDLLAHALAARYDLGVVARGYYIPSLPRTVDPVDPWRALREAPGAAQRDVSAAFDALVTPLYARVIHYDIHTHERIRDAFAQGGVDPARRSRLVRRLLFLRADELGPFDMTGIGDGPMILPNGPDRIIEQVARILADEPAILDGDAALRETVGQLALRPFDAAGYVSRDELLVTLHPLFMRWLRTAPETTRIAVLKSWSTSIRELAARTDGHIYYANEASIARLIALAELAPGVGLADEARATCDAVIASPAAAMTLRTHEVLVRGATIARALLTSS